MTVTFADLPPELLVKIFSHYIESERHLEFSKNIVPVCKTWWKLSTTSSLWRSIHVGNWNFLMSLSKREILHHTECLTTLGDRSRLDYNSLLAVLSSIRDLKYLEISNYDIDENTMKVLAEHCPNLEHLCMSNLFLAEDVRMPLKELVPIVTICGPKLKTLILDCPLPDSALMISEIAAKCVSLEVFRLEGDHLDFPIYKIMNGCPRLRKLRLRCCELVTTGGNNYTGFEDLTSFNATFCDFHALDVCSLLKNSNNLEHLELVINWNFIFRDVSKIPSNKVKVLKIYLEDDVSQDDMDVNFLSLKQAMDRWKHTLLHLEIYGWNCDVTSAFETYLHSNQCPKLKVLSIYRKNIDRTFLKTFVRKCQNLKELHVYGNHYRNHEEIINFLDIP